MANLAKTDLKYDQQFYKLMINNSRELMCYHEPDGTFLFVNETITKIAGYQPDELVGKNPYNFFHPDDRETIRNGSHTQALNGEDTDVVMYRFRKKDGDYIWLETLTKPLLDSEGKVDKLIATSREVTGQVRLREALRQSENLLKEASQMAKIGAWKINMETLAPIWSDMTYHIHDMEPGEEVDLSKALDFFPPKSRKLIEMRFSDAVQKGIPYDEVVQFVSAKGIEKWVRAIGRPEIRNGKVEKVYGTFQDVTKETEYVRELKQMADLLTHQKKQLEDFNQIVSHNLRSPISNLDLLFQCMENTEDADEKREHYRDIKSVFQSVQDLLNDLVDVVKVTNQTGVKQEKVSIEKVFNKVKLQLKGSIKKKTATIVLEELEWTSILYPLIYFESILLNLLSNALKYSSPEREPVITIRAKLENGHKFLYVEDNGLGINLKRHANKIFKLHKTFHRNVPGKGLGLYMTRNQINALGGEISVESIEGKGTTFIIDFNKYNL